MQQHTVNPVLDFGAYIAERAQDFTGRQWVFEQIDAWLADARPIRFFLLLAEPGSGKTALAARLCQFSGGLTVPPDQLTHLSPGFVSAYHFCSARDDLWIDPLTFTRSLALQLARYPEYAQALLNISERDLNIHVQQQIQHVAEGGVVQGVVIHNLTVSNLNAQDSFNRLIRDPLRTLYSNGFSTPITILVDGLDEALVHPGRPTIVELLSRLHHLPSQVRFLLTSRPEARVEEVFPETEGLLLSAPAYDQHNREDIANYIRLRLAPEREFSEKLVHFTSEQIKALIKTLADKATGNFQYITFLLQAIAQNRRTFDDLDGLPEGLDALYADSLRRVVQLGNKEWSRDYAPLIGVLSVAQESLTFAQLQAFTGQSERAAWEHVNDLQQFVESVQSVKRDGEEVDVYHLFHQSFIDFLRRRQLNPSKKKVPNTYYLPAEEWHRQVTDVCEQGGLTTIWQDAKGNPVEQGRREYARRYYITHLFQAQVWDRLCAALDTGDYGRAKIKSSPSTFAYAQDLQLGQQAVTRDELDFTEGLALLPALWRYSLLRCSLGSQVDSYPDTAFIVMAALGQQQKVLELAELLTDPRRKAQILITLGVLMERWGNKETAWQAFSQASNAVRENIGQIPGIVEQTLQMLAEVRPFEHEVLFLDEIAATAQLIDNERQRMEALVAIAVALTKAQEWEKARTVAESIPYRNQEPGILRRVVNTLIEAQLWDTATSIALSIGPNSWALIDVFNGLFLNAREWEKAKALVQFFPGSRFSTLAALNRFRAKVQPELAEELLHEMEVLARAEDDDFRDMDLSTVAKDMAEAKLWDQAVRVAWSIRDNYHKIEALDAIAQNLVEVGQPDRAEALLLQSAETLCRPGQSDHILVNMVVSLIRMQLWDSGETVAHAVREFHQKFYAFTALSEALAQVQPERAQALVCEAESIANDELDHALRQNSAQFEQSDNVLQKYAIQQRAKKIQTIIGILAKMRVWDRAITLAHSIEAKSAGRERNEAFAIIANALAVAQEWDRAISVSKAIHDTGEQDEVLSSIVNSMAAVQEWKQAESIVRSMYDDDKRDEALTALVEALTEAQEWEQALAMAQTIRSERQQAKAVVVVVKALVEAQEWDRALALAQTISNQAQDVLVVIVEALTRAQLSEYANNVRQFLENDDEMGEGADDEEIMYLASMLKLTPSPRMSLLWDSTMKAVQSLSDDQESSDILSTLIIEAMQSLTEGQQSSDAPTILFEALTKVGLWERAVEVAHSLTDKEDALLDIVLAMIDVGQLEGAVEVARSIGYHALKAEALTEIAWALAEVDPERANGLLSEALAPVQFINDDEQLKTKAFVALIEGLARARHWESAIAIARPFRKASERARILDYIAKKMVESGYTEQANAIRSELVAIRREFDATSKNRTPDEEDHSKDGGESGVDLTKNEAEERNEDEGTTDGTDERDEDLMGAGEWAKYMAQFLERERKDKELRSEIERRVQAGQPEPAAGLLYEHILGEPNFSSDRWNTTMYNIAIALAQAQHWEHAVALARSLGGGKRAISVISRVAQGVYDLSGEGLKVDALTRLAELLVKAGQRDKAMLLLFEAEAIAQSIEKDKGGDYRASEKDIERNGVLQGVISALLLAQDLDSAEEVARSMSGGSQPKDLTRLEADREEMKVRQKNHARETVISALARAQQWDRAIALIQEIGDDKRRNHYLVSLAALKTNTLISQGEHAHALQLIQREWMQVSTRNELLQRLPLAKNLIPLRPEIGWAFYGAFAWVDNFLKG